SREGPTGAGHDLTFRWDALTKLGGGLRRVETFAEEELHLHFFHEATGPSQALHRLGDALLGASSVGELASFFQGLLPLRTESVLVVPEPEVAGADDDRGEENEDSPEDEHDFESSHSAIVSQFSGLSNGDPPLAYAGRRNPPANRAKSPWGFGRSS